MRSNFREKEISIHGGEWFSQVRLSLRLLLLWGERLQAGGEDERSEEIWRDLGGVHFQFRPLCSIVVRRNQVKSNPLNYSNIVQTSHRYHKIQYVKTWLFFFLVSECWEGEWGGSGCLGLSCHFVDQRKQEDSRLWPGYQPALSLWLPGVCRL